MAVMAVIFDFDDTLLPDSTSALLDEYGIDPKDFWTGRAQQLFAVEMSVTRHPPHRSVRAR